MPLFTIMDPVLSRSGTCMSYHSDDQRSGYFHFLSAFYILELWINLYSLYFRRLEGSRRYILPNFHLSGVSFLLWILLRKFRPSLHQLQAAQKMSVPPVKQVCDTLISKKITKYEEVSYPPPVIIFPRWRSISKYSSIDMVGNRCPSPKTWACRRARSPASDGRIVNGRRG